MKIAAYFSGIKNANDAAARLKSKGFNNAVVDINDHYQEFNRGTLARVPGSENAPTLSTMILNTDPYTEDPSKRAINAASPMVSGMGNFEEITDVNYKLSLEVNDENKENVIRMIKEMGGTLKDPNLDLPHRLKDMNPTLGDLEL